MFSFYKNFLPLITGIIIFFKSHAQEIDTCYYQLSGQILDEHDNNPLAYATIYIKEINKWTIGDSLGYYHINEICEGNYIIICQHVGCNTIKKRIFINKDLHLNFYPEHHRQWLNTIQIYSDLEEKRTGQILSLTEIDLKGNLIEEQRGNSIGESLRKFPGLSTLQTGTDIWKPVIHGLHSNRIIIINNGIRQEDQQWGIEHAPNIDPFTADEISVIKGASAVRYGSDAIGGVILVTPENLFVDTIFKGNIYTLVNTNGKQGITSANFKGRISKNSRFAWRLQGTLKRGGDRRSANYLLSNTGIREANISAILAYQKRKYALELFYSRFSSNIGILNSAHIGNLTDLQNAISSDKPLIINDFTYKIENPKQEVLHHLTKLEGYYKINKVNKISFLYGWQYNRRFEFDTRRGNRNTIPSIDLNLYTHNAELIFETEQNNVWHENLGFSIFRQDNETDARTGVRRLIPDYFIYDAGSFFLLRHKQPDWLLEIGFRYNYRFLKAFKWFDRNDWESRYAGNFSDAFVKYNENGTKILAEPIFTFHNFAGNVGGLFHLNEQLSLKTNLATAFRAPNVNELFSDGLHHSAAAIEYGNLFLETEKSLKWLNTLTYQSKYLSISLSNYYQYFNRYTTLNLVGTELTIRGAFPVYTYTQVNARFWGTDLAFSMKFTPRITYKGAFSLVSVKDLDRNAYLPFIPPPNLLNNISYQISKLFFLKNFRIAMIAQTFFKQKQSPRIISVENLTTMNSEEIAQETKKGAFDIRAGPDTYHLIGIGIDSTISIKEKNHILIGLYVDNAFNTSYRSYMNRFRYYADDMGRNFKLKLKYSF